MTQSQHSQRHDMDAFSAAIIVYITFSFIPASLDVSIVKEHEVKAKQSPYIQPATPTNLQSLINITVRIIPHS